MGIVHRFIFLCNLFFPWYLFCPALLYTLVCAITSYFPFFVLVLYRLQLLDSAQSRLAYIVPDISSCDTQPKKAWALVFHEDQQVWSLWILLESIVTKMHLQLPQLLLLIKKKATNLLQLPFMPKGVGWYSKNRFWVEYSFKGCDFPANSDLFHYLPPPSLPVIMSRFTICS